MTTLVARDVFPAASSAVTVSVLSPVCNWIAATTQVALRIVPESAALPSPPRLFAQRTLYRRMLSVAVPPTLIIPVEPTSDCVPMDSTGATLSRDLQRTRSAWSSSVLPSVASLS